MDYNSIKNELVTNVLNKRGLPLKTIREYFFSGGPTLFPDPSELFNEKELDRQIRHVLKAESESCDGVISCFKKGGVNYYKIRSIHVSHDRKRVKPETDVNDTLYIGKGGEYAVLSELLFAGYNANTMIVDEGIDIIASKENKYYYIQVKTTSFDSAGKVNVHIPIENFQRVAGMETIYIIVVRGNTYGFFTYFIFRQNEIDNLITDHRIEKSESNINIKIEYNEKTKEPMFYTTKRGESTAIAYTADNKKFKF